MRKVIICLVTSALIATAQPRVLRGGEGLPEGKPTADEAAAPDLSGPKPAALTLPGSRFAYGDTTGYDFPEEEKERNIVKEVAIWVAVAAFVAFFVIEVWLKGDTDETPPPDDGKDIPPTTSAGPLTVPVA